MLSVTYAPGGYNRTAVPFNPPVVTLITAANPLRPTQLETHWTICFEVIPDGEV